MALSRYYLHLKDEKWEGDSCLGTHVRIKDFKIKKKLKLKLKKNTDEKTKL